MQEGDRQLLEQDGLLQRGDAQVEPPHDHRRQGGQVGQGAFKGRSSEHSAVEVAAGDPGGAEGLKAGPPAALMPLLGPGGMIGAVLGELRIPMRDDADEGDGCTIEVLQHLLNETEGDECICGTWHQYGNHNGGWIAVDLQDPTHMGAHGCQNTAAEDSDF